MSADQNPSPSPNSCQCLAFLKSNHTKRCSRKRKGGSIFCGIHLRAKNVKRLFLPSEGHSVSRIQKVWRGYFQRLQNMLRGPGFLNRKIINNENDFMTFEDCKDIPYDEFFSYKDKDGFVYAFNLFSIHQLLETQDYPSNPYTRNALPELIQDTVRKFMTSFSEVTQPLSIRQQMNLVEISEEQQIQLRCVEVFQRFDELELYTQVSWFLDLDLRQLVAFHHYLKIILLRHLRQSNYSQFIRSENGYVFRYSNNWVAQNTNIQSLQKYLLEIIGRLSTEGITKENCTTACYWVLTAFTHVSEPYRSQYSFLVQ